MIFFKNDYSIGAHPSILEALVATNSQHFEGYGLDEHSQKVESMIRELTKNPNCHAHMMVGGTPTNITTIAAALRPYEAVVAPRSGHIYKHETGGVEASGHKIIPMNPINGKLTPEAIERAWEEYEDEHTVIPKMAYISNTTEIGTIYNLAELEALRKTCDKHNMYLYMDGARLGSALASEECDFTLEDLGRLTDAFYIGGTKLGALMGEILVINNDEINDHFRWMIKQNRAMLAKGFLIGIQFEILLRGGMDSLYMKLGKAENAHAQRLVSEIKKLGYKFEGTSTTNQIFPILPVKIVEELEKDFAFYRWEPPKGDMVTIRLVTSFATTCEDVDAFLKRLFELSK